MKALLKDARQQSRQIEHERDGSVPEFRRAGDAVPTSGMTAEIPDQNFLRFLNLINNNTETLHLSVLAGSFICVLAGDEM